MENQINCARLLIASLLPVNKRSCLRHTGKDLSDYKFSFFLLNKILSHSQGELCILDAFSGHILVRRKVEGQVFSSPVISRENIILGCRDNNLYCFQITL